MDLNYVKKLVKLLASSEVDEIEVEEEGKRVRVAKHRTNSTGAHAAAQAIEIPGIPAAAPDASRPESAGTSVPEARAYHEIKSPIVGTFYRAPAPDAAPFVNVGSVVEPGNVLCIVEAMKLMNEIESDVAGKIIKIMVENGHPVEYDQTLFLVDKT